MRYASWGSVTQAERKEKCESCLNNDNRFEHKLQQSTELQLHLLTDAPVLLPSHSIYDFLSL